MNKKQVIRLNENQLKQIVMESVKKFLHEGCDYDPAPDNSEPDYDSQSEKEDIKFVLNVIGKTWNEIGGVSKVDKIVSLYNEGMKMIMEYEDSLKLPMGSEQEWMKGKTLAYRYKDIDKEKLYAIESKLHNIAYYEKQLLIDYMKRLDYCLGVHTSIQCY